MAQATPAVAAVSEVAHEILHYSPSQDNFGQHSVDELGLDPDVVLKTLIIEHDKHLALCCVPVSARLSLKSAAHALGWKRAELAAPAAAQRATGYVIGGISPLGTKTSLPTLIDASVSAAEAVTISGGRRGLSIQLSPGDLAGLTDARFEDLSA